MKIRKIHTPITKEIIKSLRAGDEVLITGIIFTARDAVHKELFHGRNKKILSDLSLKDKVIYYAGPTPARPGRAIGACGPTTSSRMDFFTPYLIKSGLRVMIGKGDRSLEVRRAIKEYKAVYLIATGGLGALLSARIKSCRKTAFHDLGPEAVHELMVEDFPAIVCIDQEGNNIYDKVGWKKR